MSLKFTYSLGIGINFIKSLDLGDVTANLTLTRGEVLQDTTAALHADVVYHDARTLADGANETLDIHDGSLSDAFGDALTIDKLKAIYIKNNSTDANLLIGGAAATQMGLFNDVSDVLKLRPGGELLLTAPDADGIDVTANADLKITHDGTGSSELTYDIIVAGSD